MCFFKNTIIDSLIKMYFFFNQKGNLKFSSLQSKTDCFPDSNKCTSVALKG